MKEPFWPLNGLFASFSECAVLGKGDWKILWAHFYALHMWVLSSATGSLSSVFTVHLLDTVAASIMVGHSLLDYYFINGLAGMQAKAGHHLEMSVPSGRGFILASLSFLLRVLLFRSLPRYTYCTYLSFIKTSSVQKGMTCRRGP